MKLSSVLFIAGCIGFNHQTIAQPAMQNAKIIIYKTKDNYRDKVPVILSEDKSTIISYPDPSDLRSERGLPLPDKLRRGYWLDNRGIGKDAAFLNLTYQEYATLATPPSRDEMYGSITDKNPLVALYDCGYAKDYKEPVKELKKIIRCRKKFRAKCTKIEL